MPIWIYIVLGGLVGASLGSFTSATLGRAKTGISLLKPSRCDSCEKPIQPWRNVPIITWLAQRGQGACCGAKIPVSVLGWELGLAMVGALVGGLWSTWGIVIFALLDMIFALLWWYKSRRALA